LALTSQSLLNVLAIAQEDLLRNGEDNDMADPPAVAILLLGDAGVGKSTFLS
jgi:GTPase SAR1 family protein